MTATNRVSWFDRDGKFRCCYAADIKPIANGSIRFTVLTPDGQVVKKKIARISEVKVEALNGKS